MTYITKAQDLNPLTYIRTQELLEHAQKQGVQLPPNLPPYARVTSITRCDTNMNLTLNYRVTFFSIPSDFPIHISTLHSDNLLSDIADSIKTGEVTNCEE